MASHISSSASGSPSAKRARSRDLESYDHDELVHELTEILSVGEFGTIRACTGPYDRPHPIRPPEASVAGEGYVPDVTAITRSGKLDLFAVETPLSLWSAKTARVWRTFAMQTRRHDRSAFWVVVRKPLREAVRSRLAGLHLKAWVLAL